MTHFSKHQKHHYAVIFKDGRVEVRQAESDSVEGRVYFSCKTKAFKVAQALIEQGLVCVKRTGFMVTPKGFLETEGSYYLGAVLLPSKDKETPEYAAEVAKSRMIHEVCYARS